MKSAEKILDAQVTDPVCGRHITEASALLRDEYRGTTYLFCSERCRMLFSLRPDAYAIADDAGGAGESKTPVTS